MADTVKTMDGVEIYLDTRSTEQWGQVTKTIPKGFVCVELMTDSKCGIKVGDGEKTFAQLPYAGANIGAEEVTAIVSEALKGYETKEETAKSISEAISGLGTLFTYKGRVDDVAGLPAENNKQGDVYLVGAENANEFAEYYWTGTFFDYMGKTGSVDLTDYYKKNEVDSLLNGKMDASDGTALGERVAALEDGCVKTTDRLVLACRIS